MSFSISIQPTTTQQLFRQDAPFKPCLIAVGGPTATGKTGLSLELAERLPIAVLSADSRQVYRQLDIGTAKPTAQMQAQIPHYLIDVREPTETMTVAEYQQAAQELIKKLQHTGKQLPWLVGGTGLYISAVVDGLQIPPVAPQMTLRAQLTHLGQTQCHGMLKQIDPKAAKRIHPHDSVRTVRALEVAYVTGQPLSAQQGQTPPDYPILHIGLECSAEALAARIERRTLEMIEQGLVQEVEGLCQRYGSHLPLLKTLGYAEVLGYLKGDYSLAQAQTLIVKNTRQFAKRQRTWFRKRSMIWLDAEAPNLVDQVWQLVDTFLQAI